MSAEEVVERLVALGLEEADARAYVQLSVMGSAPASEVALALRIHRTDAYRTLLRLVDAGFVTSSLGRPVTFAALAPDAAFTKLEDRERERLRALERARNELGPALASLRMDVAADVLRSTFRIVKGRAEIYSVMKDVISIAEKTVLSVNTNPAGNASAEAAGLWVRARERAVEGIDTRALIVATPDAVPRVRAMVQGVPCLRIRHLETPTPMRFFIVDARHLVMFAVNDPSTKLTAESEIAIVTDARDLVQLQVTLFEHLWEQGSPIESVAMGTSTQVGQET